MSFSLNAQKKLDAWEAYKVPVINISEIVIRKRMRKINYEKAKSLSESIKEIGLLTPVLLSGKTLVAGAHRVEAHKILGEKQIQYSPIGDANDPEFLAIYEIDENLFRHELSPAERAEHIAKRIEIMAARKFPEKLKDTTESYVKIELDKGSRKDSDKLCQKVSEVAERGAERAAKAEAKKELAESLGMETTHINAEIKNHQAVTDAGLDQNKLEELNGTQYKRVASVAKKEGAEAAKNELEVQLNKAKKKDSEIGGQLKESVLSHDWNAKLKQDINVLLSARSIISRLKKDEKLNSSSLDNSYFEDSDLTPLIEFLREKIEA